MSGTRVSMRLPLALAAVGLAAWAAPAQAGAAPPNDKRADAAAVGGLPAVVNGTTEGARLEKADPVPGCSPLRASVWYRLHAPRRQAVVARLRAGAPMDAAIAVYREQRSHFTPVTCAQTNGHGRSLLAFRAQRGGDYLVVVGERPGSSPGSFRLELVGSERPARPPGDALPAQGVHTTVDPVLDTADAWTVDMQPGSAYRINLTSPSTCLSLSIYRPGVYSFSRTPVKYLDCGGYTTFAPGPDGGGSYSLVVRAESGRTGGRPYRLLFAPATADDGAPGATLTNGQAVEQRLFGRGIDIVDLYRFTVPRPHELTTLDLQVKPNVGFDLLLLREDGTRIDCACSAPGRQRLREHIAAGHYFAAVRSRRKSGGRYRLQLLIRDITSTTLLVSGKDAAESPPGVPVTFTVQVSSIGAGGPLRLDLSRLDPLAGWQFVTAFRQRLGPGGLYEVRWTPPTVGYWRAHARFYGTPFSSFSESDWVPFHVTEPIG